MLRVGDSGLEEVRRLLRELSEDFPRAAVRAQNKIAFQVRGAAVMQMAADFDRPKSFSSSAIRYESAQLNVRPARVFLRDDKGNPAGEGHYLNVQVLGGKRTVKRASEMTFMSMGLMPPGYEWVPAGATPLDMYGNVSASLVRSIVKSLQEKDGKYVYIGFNEGSRRDLAGDRKSVV